MSRAPKDKPAKGSPRAKPRGRPTAYRREFVTQARKLAAFGATDREAAVFFEVAESTLYLWKVEHPEFSEALKVGKAVADDRVEQSLYRKATGYTFDSEKIFQFEGVVVRADMVEHVPPSDTAAIFWLKNRRPDDWRDKTDHNVNLADELVDVIAKRRLQVAEGRGGKTS